MTNTDDSFSFRGFQSPRYTQVPDELFDELMPFLSGAELKVLLYITRKTFGWKKDSDNISISQMLNGVERRHDGAPVDHGVGLSKKTLLQALNSLEAKHIILTQRRKSPERGWEPTCYRLNILTAPLGGETTPTLGEKLHQGVGAKSTPSPRGKNYPIQETALQETTSQETSKSHPHSSDEIVISNIRNGNALVFQTKAEEPQAGHQALSLDQPPDADADATSSLPLTDAPTQPPRGFQTPASVLQRRSASRDDVASEARQAIGSYMRDFALEFGDQAPLRSTVSRAVRLYENSGLSLSGFIGYLHSARSQTKEYSGSIRKGRGDRSKGWQPANKVPYFFAVLEDQLGFREHTDREPTPLMPQQLPMQAPRQQEPARSNTDRPRPSIGGPRVRVVPLHTNEHEDTDTAADSITLVRGRPAPQNRSKSSRLPLQGTNGTPAGSDP